jgi:hypothetical protein
MNTDIASAVERDIAGDMVHRSGFCIGRVSVQVEGACCEDVTLDQLLEPFRVKTSQADIRIKIEWSGGLRPTSAGKLFDSGSIWRLYEDGAGYQFDFSAPMFGNYPYKRLFVDNQFREATLQMNKEFIGCAMSDVTPLQYPLDELLITHRLTRERAIELHSCGIIASGVGNLFVGHSGAGKSTTTRLWTSREEVEVLSDDRIIVRRDEGAVAGTPCEGTGGAGEQQVLRLRDGFASRSGHFAQDDRAEIDHYAQDDRVGIDRFAHDDRAQEQIPHPDFAHVRNDRKMRMYGTPWHGEAMFASPNSAPLTRIFVLEHGHGNVVTRLTKSQAVAELFARSFVPFHRHEYVESALEFLQELAEAVPCYRYSFEPDMGAVEKILDFRD